MKNFALLLYVMLFGLGCERVFIGKDAVNNPENNFELFWTDFNEHYGLFQARKHNWDSIYKVYRPIVTSETTDEELWTVFKEMIIYLDDSHTFIAAPPPFDRVFVSGSELDSITEEEFSLDLIKREYVEDIKEITSITEIDEDLNALYGNVKGKNIGYVHFNAVEGNDINFMDKVLEGIGDKSAIILDIRNNYGGDDQMGEAIAGRFADDREYIYSVQEKSGPGSNDFAKKKEYYSSRMGEEHYDKPLIVLTDRVTVSAAEILLLHLKSFEQVTQIGDTTAGDFSDTGMRRFLPNSWQYQYSIMMFLLPDGTSLDGLGHVPEIQIKNTTQTMASGQDVVFEKAIDYLFEEYGID
jgi:hypothetical protein